jgi:hypothetical protein
MFLFPASRFDLLLRPLIIQGYTGLSIRIEENHFVTLIGPFVDFLINRVNLQCRTSCRARDIRQAWMYTNCSLGQLRGLRALQIYKAGDVACPSECILIFKVFPSV